jgi:hypothetical protein
MADASESGKTIIRIMKMHIFPLPLKGEVKHGQEIWLILRQHPFMPPKAPLTQNFRPSTAIQCQSQVRYGGFNG